MKLLRDARNQSASRRLSEVNRAFEGAVPGEQEAAWSRLQRAMQSRRGDDRARVERQVARRVGWRLAIGAGALATLGLIVWVVVRPRPIEDHAGLAIARAVGSPGAQAGASAIEPAPMPDRALPPEIEPAPDLRPAPVASSPPVALAPGRSPAGRRRAREALAAGRCGRAPRTPAPALRAWSRCCAAGIDIDIKLPRRRGTEPVPSGGGEIAAPAPVPNPPTECGGPRRRGSRFRWRSVSILAPDSGRFSVSARGEKVDVVVRRPGSWRSGPRRRLLATTVVAGQRLDQPCRCAGSRRARRRGRPRTPAPRSRAWRPPPVACARRRRLRSSRVPTIGRSSRRRRAPTALG